MNRKSSMGPSLFPIRSAAPPLLFFMLCVLCAACSEDAADPPLPQPSSETLFGPSIKSIALEIDYVAGAEPYTGALGNEEDLWALFRANASRLFADKEIESPSLPNQMELLAEEGGGNYTTSRIIDLAHRHRNLENTKEGAAFYAIWLDGFFEDAAGVHEDILGMNIGDTGIIAMFKPVLSASDELPLVVRFLEQMTLIHEFGHAAGLVNNGIPMASDHEDTNHKGHCADPDCNMYWANEQIQSLTAFAKRFMDTGNAVVFDSACLADVDALSAQMRDTK